MGSEELRYRMGWVGTVLINFFWILSSIKTMIVVLSHESFYAVKLITKDSLV